MSQTLPPEFFRNNRAILRKKIQGSTPIVLAGNGLIRRSRDDDAYPFHQESNFWYLTGLDEPDLILVIDGDSDYIILPEKDKRHLEFTGTTDVKKLAKASGISTFLQSQDGLNKLSDRLKKAGQAASIKSKASYSKIYSVYTNPSGRKLTKQIKRINPNIKLVDISPRLVELRVIKQPVEIKAIENAISHSGEVLKIISNGIDEFANESDIQAEVVYYQAKKGLGSAFAPIVANGKNACTLHYQKNNSKLDKSLITLIDTGYIFNGYCSDITRVICKQQTKRQKTVFNNVLEIQEYAFSLLKPGVKPNEYEKSVARFAGEKLKELGLIKKIDAKSIQKYFKHRTSHFLGIDVHDDGNYKENFEESMVITVEPGIYIKEEEIGVRIEDNVVITKEGYKNLSKAISKNLDSIKILKA